MHGIVSTEGVVRNNTVAYLPQSASPTDLVQPLPPLQTAVSYNLPGGNDAMANPYLIADTASKLPPSLFNSAMSVIQSQEYIHPSIAEDLRRISFFDLMKASPSIHQLCNPDFKELVEKMVTLQRDSTFFSQTGRETPLEIMDIQTHGGILAVSEMAKGRSNGSYQGEVSNHCMLDQNQDVPYNHLLYAPQHTKSRPDPQTPYYRKSPATPLKQEDHVYYDKKKAAPKTNYAQKLIKNLVFMLNSLSSQLSKHLE